MSFMKLFKKEESPYERMRKEIDSIEFKKRTIQASLDEDRAETDAEIEKILVRIGSVVYESHLAGITDYKFDDYFAKIATLREEFKQQKTRTEEIINNYDYEINILEASCGIPSSRPAQSTVVQDGCFCGKCGNTMSNEDIFCNRCGTKKAEEQVEDTAVDNAL